MTTGFQLPSPQSRFSCCVGSLKHTIEQSEELREYIYEETVALGSIELILRQDLDFPVRNPGCLAVLRLSQTPLSRRKS